MKMKKELAILSVAILVVSGLVALGAIDKEFDPTSAELGEVVDVTVDITIPGGATSAYFLDYLPSGLKYVQGSYQIGGSPVTPDYSDDDFILDYLSLSPSSQQITFQVKVVEAKTWDDWTVTNTARLGYYDAGWYYQPHSEQFTILAFGDDLTKEVDGPTEVDVGEEAYWLMMINFTNNFGYTIDDAVITDRLGGDLEVHDVDYNGPSDTQTTAYQDPDTIDPSYIDGTWDLDVKGKTRKVFIEWDVASVANGGTVTLEFYISTDMNTGKNNNYPNGHQEYTSDGTHVLNSGATLKFTDDEGDQLSIYTDSIEVEAYYD
jgi:uncharacterized repeat protein (TIGR01451 family)